MNLLRDKRDDERPAESALNERLSEDQFQQPGSGIEDQPAVKTKKAKNAFSTLLIAAAIFIIAILITYFGFYKPKEGSRLADAGQNNAQVDSTTDAVDDAESTQPKSVDAAVEQAAVSGSRTTGESSLSTATTVMHTIQNALGAGIVTAFFFDDGSFSAEVETASVSDAKNMYNSLKSSIPAGSELTSAEPNSSQALITGSLNPGLALEPTGLAKSEIESELRQIASAAGTSVSSLNVDAPAGDQAFVVMRLSGSFQTCQTFIATLAQKSWNVNISKLILMSDSSDAFTFVLRFYM